MRPNTVLSFVRKERAIYKKFLKVGLVVVYYFFIAFVGLVTGIVGTCHYYKRTIITLSNTHRKQIDETDIRSYRKGYDSGVDFARRNPKRMKIS